MEVADLHFDGIGGEGRARPQESRDQTDQATRRHGAAATRIAAAAHSASAGCFAPAIRR